MGPHSPDMRHETSPSPGHETWYPLLVTSGGDHWRPIQTCSLEDDPTTTDICWLLKYVQWQAVGTHSVGMLSRLYQTLESSGKVLSFGF